ncbi:carbohydrate-binding module family 1 protein [Amniculicola lignicola CBS 123094]|uniref:Beta-xylanase n=1 Tax=Amniculicola lignicola CBS 123094 TaxID=1392246 RepID=A0A6A5WR38_9PLEO|nr:carbohydrate-binding module family 1 protein [Amniculicola lignicola CBS 123094]
MLSSAFTLLFAAAAVVGSPVERRAADGLNTRAVAAGKQYFGSATDNGELTDTAYAAGLANTADFGQITPGNSMKWDATEKSRDTFTFTNGDVIADLAAKNGQKLRCHTLVWYSQLPTWVSSGGFDNATLITIMKNHITKTVTHWKGKCFHWDVANEALNEDGTYRANVFYNTIGPAYLPIAFAAAAAADPAAKLYYNDYNIESAGAKSTGAQNIVKLIKLYGAKIDGVGLQAHFIAGSTPSQSAQTSNLNAFVALGVEVAITELDIRQPTPATAAMTTQQAKDYAATVGACKAVAKCVGFTIWDYTDKYSWIPSVFSGQGAALPWDSNLVKKTEVYNAILNAWGPAATGAATATTQTTVVSTKVAVVSSTAVVTTSIAAVATSKAASSTVTPAASATAVAGTVAKWGQCGGNAYTGPKGCVSGTTCTKQNDWYSQCL